MNRDENNLTSRNIHSLSGITASLRESTRAILTAEDFGPAARTIFDACRKLIGARAGYVALLSADGNNNELLFLESGGLSCRVDASLPMPVRGLREEAYRTGRPVYDNRFPENPHQQYLPPGHVRLENVLFAPLVGRDQQPVGLLGLANKAGGFTPDDARIASIFSEFAAIAFQDRLMRQKLQREVTISKALADLSASLVSKASVADISQQVLDSGKALTGSPFGYVGHIDPATGNLVSSTMTRDIWDSCRVSGKSVIFETFTGLWGWVLKNHQPLLTNHPATDPRSSGTPAGHLPVHRFLSAPALAGGELLGQVALANKSEDYTDSDLEIVQRLADIYAIALQRKHFDDALQRTANEWQNTFDAMPHGVMLLSNDFTVIRANDKVVRMLQTTPEDICGRPCYELIHGKDRPASFCPHTQTMRDGRKHEYEFYEPRFKKFFQVTTAALDGEKEKRQGSVHIIRDITGRKQAEERLARLQAAVNISADALFIIDPEARQFLDVNQTACESLGYTRAELLQQGPQNIKPHYPDEQLAAIFRDVLSKTDGTGSIETVHRRKDGTEFPVEVLLRPLVYKNQRLIVAAARDLTERKFAEEILRDSLQTSEDLVTAIPSGLLIYQFQEPDRLILRDYNPAARQILGDGIKHCTGYDFADIWRQENAGNLKQRLLEVFTTGAPLTIEDLSYADEQTTATLRLHAFTMPRKQLGVAVEDVTERNRIAAIVDTLWAGIAQFDRHNHMVYCNHQFREMFGGRATAHCWDELSRSLSRQQAETMAIQLADMAAGRKTTTVAQRFTVENRHFEYSAVSRKDALGQYAGALFIFRDITPEIQQQQEVIEQEKQLSLAVLVAGIAHDLNNPLSGLQGCLRRIRQNPENREQTLEYLDLMEDALEKTGQVVQQLVQLSGKDPGRFQPVHLTEVLHQAARFALKGSDRPQVQLLHSSVPEELWIPGDAGALFHVFLNLLLNAYDAVSDQGTIIIGAAADEQTQTVTVEITDDGEGMAPEMQSRVFSPYFTTKPPGQGTGLGLSISRQTLSRHGGTITLDSHPGRGTTVYINLPRLPGAPQQ